ncbi:MAG TPA: hypothetical protein VH951_05250 [Dehalococcoidia bacterium]
MVTKVRATNSATGLDRACIEALAYSDVFDFPLTSAEVWRALPVAATPSEVEAALAQSRTIERKGGYFTLWGRGQLAGVRERRARTSVELWPRARRYGGLIAALPFVRMVAVTGALAVDNSEAGDDVDFMIVTKPGRVWLARAMTMAVVRMAALRGLTLCPNFMLGEDALALSDRSLYTAHELAQVVPLAGFGVYARMMRANEWYRERLPNAAPAARGPDGRPRLMQSVGERLLGGRMGNWLEGSIMRRKAAELRLEAGDNAEAVFDASMCKGHVDAHGRRTEAALVERLARLEALT